jgi:hypothetical protein
MAKAAFNKKKTLFTSKLEFTKETSEVLHQDEYHYMVLKNEYFGK